MGLLDSLDSALKGAVSTSSRATSSAKLSEDLFSGIGGWMQSSLLPIITTVLIFVTILFVFYGSFLYFTAYGDEAKAQKAKKTITYAFVGFIIGLMAFGISSYTKRIITKSGAGTDTPISVPVSPPK